jgi:hypothetical protein
LLDDMSVLRDAVAGYRAAATAAGATWPGDAAPGGGQPPDLNRLFDVDHVAEQVIWLASNGLEPDAPLPEGGALLPWSTDPAEWLDYLSFAIATPVPGRNQLPLFFFDHLVFTFVLAGDREGEIWRYEIDPDVWGAVRAANSLAALFTTWTAGIAAGVVTYRELDRWLLVGGDAPDPFALLLERTPGLDPFAFPVFTGITHEPLLRARQRECGVDMDCVARGAECQEQLLHAIATARVSLGL